MDVDRPGPGEELNDGPQATVPRQAATVIVLRGGAGALEVLLVQRNPAARFMGGAWVFPGGAVDAADGADSGDPEAAHRRAAVRELEEEASLGGVDPASLVRFSQWITPAQVKVRFDTHFFLAAAPDDAAPAVDGAECVDFGWFTPEGALAAHRAGELLLVFPTIKHLEQLARFDSATELLDFARGREVVAVEPRVVMGGEMARIVLPGEPGYEDAATG
ncbi:NUDIX hydrolase [Conexibacter woesei]|uniref:NUDIX hydrolase n=1 Tax=Conexibacter woesei TaxID=191495 RepID=UPI0006863B99|nr:NUDIX hydrolase [Conexibacter woesei]